MKRIIKIVTFYDDGTFSESVPSMAPSPFPAPYPQYNPTCTQCGLQIDKMLGYVCPNPRCPTGLGPITCCTSEK